jgi:hypothetical protein
MIVADLLLEAINKAGDTATTGGTFTPRSQAIGDYERFISAAVRRAEIKQSD